MPTYWACAVPATPLTRPAPGLAGQPTRVKRSKALERWLDQARDEATSTCPDVTVRAWLVYSATTETTRRSLARNVLILRTAVALRPGGRSADNGVVFDVDYVAGTATSGRSCGWPW